MLAARKGEVQNVIAPEPSQLGRALRAHCSGNCTAILERRECRIDGLDGGRVEVVGAAITDPRERRFRCAGSDEFGGSVSRPLAVEVLLLLAFRRIASLRAAGREWMLLLDALGGDVLTLPGG